MESAFGIDHVVAKGLKPEHVAAMKRVRVAERPKKLTEREGAQHDYAFNRLARHELGTKYPGVRDRMGGSAEMYRKGEQGAVKLNQKLRTIRRKGKTGIRAMEGPKVTYGRRKGHLRLVKRAD